MREVERDALTVEGEPFATWITTNYDVTAGSTDEDTWWDDVAEDAVLWRDEAGPAAPP